jgi:hypothetical protein
VRPFAEHASAPAADEPRPPWAPPQPSQRDHVEAVWTARFLGVALFVLVVGGTFALTVYLQRPDGPVVEEAKPVAPVADEAIGPVAGTPVPPYIGDRKLALAAAQDARVAVVSLAAYASEADARAAVGSIEVIGFLVAAPGATPVTVTDGLDAWAKEQAKADESERAEIKSLIPTVDDVAFKKFYESEVVRLDKAIADVSPTSPVVFGVVVRAPATDLQAIGAKPGVRLVDVGVTAQTKPDAAFRGLRPEETEKAGLPPNRPV